MLFPIQPLRQTHEAPADSPSATLDAGVSAVSFLGSGDKKKKREKRQGRGIIGQRDIGRKETSWRGEDENR